MIRFTLGLLLSVSTLACGGDSSTPDGSTGDCPAVTCELACTDGFRRGADGCEICECNEMPQRGCTADEDCVVGIDWEDCCRCGGAYAAVSIDGHSCIAPRGDAPPPGCVPDPSCAGAACRCEMALRAVCEANVCEPRFDCAAGEVMQLGGCTPACASHADCTVAADYGSCCGGCSPLSRAFVDADRCYAERQSESECSPGAGACDGLGCASAPTDCTMFGGAAVCLEDGTCGNAGPDGACPTGTMDMGGVCVPDP